MHRTVKTIFVAAFFLLMTLPLSGNQAVYMDIGQSDLVPIPRLLQPHTDTFDLTGKDALEFKWSPHEGSPTQRDYYDFRLYKGYDMLAPALIFKQRIGPRESSFILNSDMFENDQVYTWSLRQVYTGSLKSRRAFQSFKVIKKFSKQAEPSS